MTKHRRLALTCGVLATAAVAFAFAPAFQDRLSTITLVGCDIGIVPETGGLVLWQDQDPAPFNSNSEYGTVFSVWVPSGQALKAGDTNGNNRVDLTSGALNTVSLLYTPSAGTLTLTIDNENSNVGDDYQGTVPVSEYSGTFDQLAPASDPYITEVRSRALNKVRIRIWMNSFGLETAFTLEG